MNQILTFIIHHWMLSSLLVVCIAAYIILEMTSNKPQKDNISPQAAVNLINHQNAVIIDLRNESAFLEGHIVGALNIPSQTLDKKIGTLQKYKETPILLVCARGMTGKTSADLLKQKGFQALNLEGGIEAWRQASLPLVKKS